MRLFDAFGYPTRDSDGDLALVDYLFLGDYVDRGPASLETICLLLALKAAHPRHVWLLRGNHECADVNVAMGFYAECVAKLGAPAGASVWRRLNQLFEWLPLAAVIEERVLCVHGGIGRHLASIQQIDDFQRPLGMEAVRDDPLLTDLLWSDPTAHDSVEGVHENVRRGPGVASFGPDRVRDFCAANGLELIVRAHECVMDGFERFAQGHLITVFSATNYCGTTNNAGAILVVGRDLVVVAKLIHPMAPEGDATHGWGSGRELPAGAGPDTPYGSLRGSLAFTDDIYGGGSLGVATPSSLAAAIQPLNMGSAGNGSNPYWSTTINRDRPPTPPRRPVTGR